MWRRRRVRRDGSRPVMSTAVPPPGRVCQGRNVSSCGRNNHVKASQYSKPHIGIGITIGLGMDKTHDGAQDLPLGPATPNFSSLTASSSFDPIVTCTLWMIRRYFPAGGSLIYLVDRRAC